MYKRIHKIHHEHKVTTSIAAIHAHPLEYLIGNAIPATLGPFILGRRMHMSSYFAWGVWRIAEALQGHSGYDFTWNPYRFLHLTSDGKEHAFHHSENVDCEVQSEQSSTSGVRINKQWEENNYDKQDLKIWRKKKVSSRGEGSSWLWTLRMFNCIDWSHDAARILHSWFTLLDDNLSMAGVETS